jgi:hypothetical protein
VSSLPWRSMLTMIESGVEAIVKSLVGEKNQLWYHKEITNLFFFIIETPFYKEYTRM